MTQKQMFNIIPTLQKLVGIKLPIKSSYAIFRLSKEIDSQKDFFIEEERKLIDKYKGSVDETGRITFKEQSNFEPFIKEYTELNNTEVVIKEQLPIVIKLDAVEDGNFAPADFLTLEGIIDFE
jgi:hypothetical protein